MFWDFAPQGHSEKEQVALFLLGLGSGQAGDWRKKVLEAQEGLCLVMSAHQAAPRTRRGVVCPGAVGLNVVGKPGTK